jgi:hypothetical protein
LATISPNFLIERRLWHKENNMKDNPRDDEIAFVAGLINSEVSRLRAQTGPLSAGADTAELRLAQERLIDEIGRLSARLVVVEQAIEQRLLDASPAAEPRPDAPASESAGSDAQTANPAERDIDGLHDWRTFHDIEVDSRGRRYAWTTGRSFKTRLDPGADPVRPYIQVFFVAIVRPSYAKRAELFVNGQRLKHIVSSTDGELCLEARLPSPMLGSAVEMELRLPATHSLALPGEAHRDWRDGGIAVTHVALSRESRAPWVKRLIR